MSYQMPLLFVVIAVTLLYAFSKKRKIDKLRCVQTVTVILTLFSGFRSWWMGDLIKYYTQFRSCNGTEWVDAVFDKGLSNLGLRLFFRLIGAMHLKYEVCIFLIALLVAVSLGILVYRYSPSPYWSYLIYISMGFYLFTYSGLKQSIAMSLLIFAAMAYFDDKWSRMLIWTLAAALFHAPALIFLLLLLLHTKRINLRYIYTIIVLFAICFLFKGQLVGLLSELYYDDQDTFENVARVGGRFIMMAFILVVSLILRPLKNWDRVYTKTFNIMIMSLMCQIFSVYDNNFTRLADYFFQFSVIYIPMMLEPGREQAKQYSNHRSQIRYWSRSTYVLAGLAITIFALWYYNSYVDASYTILKDYYFFWQLDPYSLYGS